MLNNYTNRVKPIELLSDIHLYDTVFTYLIYRLIKDGKIIITYKDERYWKSIIKVKKEER